MAGEAREQCHPRTPVTRKSLAQEKPLKKNGNFIVNSAKKSSVDFLILKVKPDYTDKFILICLMQNVRYNYNYAIILRLNSERF